MYILNKGSNFVEILVVLAMTSMMLSATMAWLCQAKITTAKQITKTQATIALYNTQVLYKNNCNSPHLSTYLLACQQRKLFTEVTQTTDTLTILLAYQSQATVLTCKNFMA